MSIKCRIINALCRLSFRREYTRYINGNNIRRIQLDKLHGYLVRNKDTMYGKQYSFNKIKSYEDFKRLVPLTVYEDYLPYIKKICKGKKHVLTYEDVLLLELTSGSSSVQKMIPYTKSLQHEFQCGIKPWLYDIYNNYKGVINGKSYWSVTPVTSKKSFTKCGIPIGFEEDSEYLGGVFKYFYNSVFAVNSSVKFVSDMDRFYYKTCLQLLKCRELTLVSVWNPEYFIILLRYMTNNAKRLANELPPKYRNTALRHMKNREYEALFPRLRIISCWADASAKKQSLELKKLFPNVALQPKGLLATECFVSFPLSCDASKPLLFSCDMQVPLLLHNENGACLSVNSHFFEFKDTASGEICLADELKINKFYEVIVTTGGGFYRYCIKDIIKVISIKNNIPRIVFIGRSDRTSDMFGEKISEAFVSLKLSYLEKISDFYMLSPQYDCYVLYIRTNERLSARHIDDLLSESFHYNYCRKLTQLKPLRIFILTGNPHEEYLNRCVKENKQRLGDIKPCILSLQSDWDKYFNGYFLGCV